MRESKFQKELIWEIKQRFPGAMVFKNDAGYKQGIPDLTILYKNKWACLECKGNKDAHHQPNQDYYISKMNDMSFASFVYPENKEDVLNAMEQAFQH